MYSTKPYVAPEALMMMAPTAEGETFYEDDAYDTSIPDLQKVTKKNNILPLWGNQKTMNLNGLVLENVLQCTYYKQVLAEANTYQQIVDEIYMHVRHLEPWEKGTRKVQGMTGMCGGVRGVGAGGVISSAFCLLFKLFNIRITRKQLVSMLNSNQSAYLRGLGFMYIRFCQPPSDLWAWLEPYLDDEDSVDPRSGGGDELTFGQICRMMLTKLDWYGTLFPRIPVPIQKDIDEKFRERNRLMLEEQQGYEGERTGYNAQRHAIREMEREHDRKRKGSPTREGEKKKKQIRCDHHLRHHHCRKHRKECPKRAKAARAAAKEAEEKEKEANGEEKKKESGNGNNDN
ncbi:hypothetical protein PFISCL1PPCAC_23840 [Pristionchus fissidentatus]|uniref:Pre-mRNA-splicing factor 38 n=1 Tax=Pristionchus fissidentatus TaxID=1538716 RepID=A0AAV5WPJ6_9BILA|nr:hypothetical protein PFISCL1PPCAC_23840 [Pristionchus fissidentatus]